VRGWRRINHRSLEIDKKKSGFHPNQNELWNLLRKIEEPHAVELQKKKCFLSSFPFHLLLKINLSILKHFFFLNKFATTRRKTHLIRYLSNENFWFFEIFRFIEGLSEKGWRALSFFLEREKTKSKRLTGKRKKMHALRNDKNFPWKNEFQTQKQNFIQRRRSSKTPKKSLLKVLYTDLFLFLSLGWQE